MTYPAPASFRSHIFIRMKCLNSSKNWIWRQLKAIKPGLLLIALALGATFNYSLATLNDEHMASRNHRSTSSF